MKRLIWKYIYCTASILLALSLNSTVKTEYIQTLVPEIEDKIAEAQVNSNEMKKVKDALKSALGLGKLCNNSALYPLDQISGWLFI